MTDESTTAAAEPPTKKDLLERARELDIAGRSTMDVPELQAAIAAAERALVEEEHPPLLDVATGRAAKREKTQRVIGSRHPIQED